MKVVILAGGLGTRISEETTVKPKPMVEIGDMPILWHIMKIYYSHGITDFVICLGYKGFAIKQFFQDYALRSSSVSFDMKSNKMSLLSSNAEPWNVTLVDTGELTMTGGRIKRVREYLGEEPFCLTYGDGVSDINVTELVEFHKQQDSLVTLTAVQPPGRFGAISLASDQTRIDQFQEKPEGDGAWINGGFFVVDPRAIDEIEGDETSWEQKPLKAIANQKKLSAFRHRGFWHPMDTLRDKHYLDELWKSGEAPWKNW